MTDTTDTTDVADTELLALHALAVKKMGTAATVAPVAGLDEEAASAAISAAEADGRVRSGKRGSMLTPAGREWLDAQYPQVYADLRADPAAGEAYAAFEEINREVLGLMTRWQTIVVGGTEVPNDHSDAEHDARLIDELAGLHRRAVPVLDRFVALVPRLAVHRDALGAALERASAGETDYVSGVRVASYHTVWFEQHEDLLRLLGRTREE